MTMMDDESINLPAATESQSFELGAQLRLFNASLKRRRKAMGLTQRQLAEKVGSTAAYIGHIETMRQRPGHELLARLAEALLCHPHDLWPDWLAAVDHPVIEQTTSVDSQSFSQIGERLSRMLPSPPMPNIQEMREAIEESLGVLSEREAKIVRLRFGFDGQPMTYAELSKVIKVTRERVRQIESRAIGKLRLHKRPLADAIDGYGQD
jgi:RNA polymerase sigma factor (sigma-70 family)